MRKNKENPEEQQERRPERKTSRAGFSKFCAFWGITFSGLLYLVNLILQLVLNHTDLQAENLANCINGIDFVSKLALLVAIAIPAYGYVTNKKIGWKIIYILAIVFYACFSVYRLI